MKFLCDSNFGESNVSFAPLSAYRDDDGSIVVLNPCRHPDNTNPQERYSSLDEAVEWRGFIARWARTK